jgi:hypothetical protein
MLFVALGFISLKMWSFLHPSQKIRLSESLIEAIIFSSFNHIVITGLYFLLKKYLFVWFILALGVFPLLWPIVLYLLLKMRVFKKARINLIPKSWDYFFSKRECCFMLIHLNNGRMIGGLYGTDSFTSSYPEKEDLYLQEIWEIDSQGGFIKKIPGSKGILVNHDVVEYIELFNVEGEKDERKDRE